MKKKIEKKIIPEKKIKAVKELTEFSKKYKTIFLASIKGLPGSQFQEIKKKLRGKAEIRVPKKTIMLRVLNSSENKDISILKDKIKEDTAILFSDLDSFDLAGELVQNRSAIKAKVGQEAPTDIEVSEGPTELVPGPAVSELSSMGIKIAIEGGKINIKESKIIVKKGEKISQKACDLMSKLDIKPFYAGFEPIASFDVKEAKLYTEIKIDREGTLNELKVSYGKALPFAVNIGYISNETITLLIQKAGRHETALLNLTKENTKQNNQEENA